MVELGNNIKLNLKIFEIKFFAKYFYYLGRGKITPTARAEQIIELVLSKKNLLLITNFRQHKISGSFPQLRHVFDS